MPTVRLSASRTLPVRRYVNPPILVGEGWTPHEVTQELADRLLEFGRGRVVIHQDDMLALSKVGVEVVDNELVRLPATAHAPAATAHAPPAPPAELAPPPPAPVEHQPQPQQPQAKAKK